MKTIFLLLCILIVAGCKQRGIDKMNQPDLTMQKQIRIVEASMCLMGKHVGFDNEPNRIYTAFQNIATYASHALLYELSKRKSVVLKMYCYDALWERKSPFADSITVHSAKDSTFFCIISNDTNSYGYVNEYTARK